jgi:hypothetical protein
MAPEFGKPIYQLPLIPANVLKKHHVHEPLDTRFRSAARLLQALWRKDRDLPIGRYVNEGAGKVHFLWRPILQEFGYESREREFKADSADETIATPRAHARRRYWPSSGNNRSRGEASNSGRSYWRLGDCGAALTGITGLVLFRFRSALGLLEIRQARCTVCMALELTALEEGARMSTSA